MRIDDIEQIDVVLAEDCQTVLFMGYTADEDQTFVCSITLPMPVDPERFLPDEWAEIRNLAWTVH